MPSRGIHSATIWSPRDRDATSISAHLPSSAFDIRSKNKKWTRRELAGLVARQDAEERTIVLPVWHEVDQNVIAGHLPSLAGILAAKVSDGPEKVIADIVRAMGPPAK